MTAYKCKAMRHWLGWEGIVITPSEIKIGTGIHRKFKSEAIGDAEGLAEELQKSIARNRKEKG